MATLVASQLQPADTTLQTYTLTLNWAGKVEDPKLGLAPLQKYTAADVADEEVKKVAKGAGQAIPKGLLTRITPVLHTDPTFLPEVIPYEDMQDLTLQKKTEKVETYFQALVAKGQNYNFSFGKQLTVIDLVSAKQLLVTCIGDRQWTLPAFAADFVPILKGKSNGKEVYYWVGIIRQNPPGKDKPGTAGGFCNVKKENGIDVFSSLMYTALKEGKQEIKSRITLKDRELYSLKTDYNTQEVEGILKFGDLDLDCKIVHTATLPTSDEMTTKGGEQIQGAHGHKRVHVAASIGVYATVPDTVDLTKELVLANFKAGSDAADLVVLDVTDAVKGAANLDSALSVASGIHKSLEMGIGHHREILQHGFLAAHQHFKGKEEDVSGKVSQTATAKQQNVFVSMLLWPVVSVFKVLSALFSR